METYVLVGGEVRLFENCVRILIFVDIQTMRCLMHTAHKNVHHEPLFSYARIQDNSDPE